jgi:hypothetical protein
MSVCSIELILMDARGFAALVGGWLEANLTVFKQENTALRLSDNEFNLTFNLFSSPQGPSSTSGYLTDRLGSTASVIVGDGVSASLLLPPASRPTSPAAPIHLPFSSGLHVIVDQPWWTTRCEPIRFASMAILVPTLLGQRERLHEIDQLPGRHLDIETTLSGELAITPSWESSHDHWAVNEVDIAQTLSLRSLRCAITLAPVAVGKAWVATRVHTDRRELHVVIITPPTSCSKE